ncbi:MAG: hypothetical protein U0528_21170 [Anaerolineae bacterium]|nr:hypothetical protein [Anaerolineae bacterium]
MSNYDPEDDDLEAAMSGDQEGDDFANFDPQRYMRRRGRPVVSDGRDEYQLGTESHRRNIDGDDLEDTSIPRSNRVRYPARFDSGELDRIRRTGNSGNFLDVALGVIVGVGGTSGCARRLLILVAVLLLLVIGFICIGGVVLLTRLLSGG